MKNTLDIQELLYLQPMLSFFLSFAKVNSDSALNLLSMDFCIGYLVHSFVLSLCPQNHQCFVQHLTLRNNHEYFLCQIVKHLMKRLGNKRIFKRKIMLSLVALFLLLLQALMSHESKGAIIREIKK